MKRKNLNTRLIAMMLCCIMLVGALAGCANNSSPETVSPESTNAEQEQAPTSNPTSSALTTINLDVEPTRANYTALAEELKIAYEQNSNDTEVALAYAEKLIELGDMDKAGSVLNAVLDADASNAQALYLHAEIEYLCGNYAQAEIEYEALLRDHPDYKAAAERGLEFVYYQTNQYQKVRNLSGENRSETGNYEMMQAFGDRLPYEVSWANTEKKAIIPFVVTDPLPLVELEVNGEMRHFLIDTGASETYLNESVADAMDIQPIATMIGEYAGGIVVESKFGVLDSMKLNDAVIESVPIIMANLDHFAPMYDVELSGIIGTGVFRQFHVTMDYINGALILAPRGENRQPKSDEIEVQFIMANTHFFLSKANINGKEVNLFPDSGLYADEGLLLPIGTMGYTGISLPETTPAGEDEVGGLGGNDFSAGPFNTEVFQMGDLPVVKDMAGLYGVFPEVYYFNEDFGVFVDGIISHVYLKDFIWTLDFDRMTMTFAS